MHEFFVFRQKGIYFLKKEGYTIDKLILTGARMG